MNITLEINEDNVKLEIPDDDLKESISKNGMLSREDALDILEEYGNEYIYNNVFVIVSDEDIDSLLKKAQELKDAE